MNHHKPLLTSGLLRNPGATLSEPSIALALIIAIVYGALAVGGAIRGFSPVPFWDMWDGTLGFYMRQATEPDAWWSQHNEHRIVLARALFFLDLRYFGGTGAFLIIINYVLSLAVFGILAFCAMRMPDAAPDSRRFTAFLIMTFSLLWTQSNNLTWGFQSQFWLAQLLPLAALVLVHLSCKTGRWGTLLFAAALATGALAAGSMANGALGGVMVVAACVLGRQSWKRCLVAALVAAAVLMLYFRGYQSPGGHGSVLHSLMTDPLGMLKYLFAYLGSPFAHLSPRGILSEGLAIAAGALVATASLWIGVRVLFRRHRTVGIDLVLALFLAYLGISAVAIAGGRMLFGIESAVASRYTTPALLAMCCVIIFVRSSLSRRNMDGRGVRMAFLAIPLLFLPLQITAVREDRFVGFEKMTAALSLELGIKDDKQISWIFPNAEWALRIADPASEADISIFSSPAIHDARRTLGAEYEGRPSVQCALVPPVKEAIDGNWLRLQGGLVQDSLEDAMTPIFLLDSQGRVVGRGLTAEAEPAAAGAARGAPFKAYVKNAVAGDTLTLVVPSTCTATFKLE